MSSPTLFRELPLECMRDLKSIPFWGAGSLQCDSDKTRVSPSLLERFLVVQLHLRSTQDTAWPPPERQIPAGQDSSSCKVLMVDFIELHLSYKLCTIETLCGSSKWGTLRGYFHDIFGRESFWKVVHELKWLFSCPSEITKCGIWDVSYLLLIPI